MAAVLALGWIASVGFGLRTLLKYENAPGKMAAVPTVWPASTLALATDRPTLMMLAHPHCPCTRASVGQLAEIMAQIQGQVAAYVIFAKPVGSASDWDDTGLRRSAAAIPGVTVFSDLDGAEARRFGAETSGHTLLFAPDGRLLFSGGITPSRGHAGDNAGESAIVALVRNKVPARSGTLVFGCPLPNAEETALNPLASR